MKAVLQRRARRAPLSRRPDARSAARASTAACSCRASWTTRRSSSRTRARSSSRSAAPATRRCSSRPACTLRAGLRLVLSLLPRSRALPAARRHAARDAARRGRREGRSRAPAAARCRRTGATPNSTSSRARARPARRCCRRSAPPKPASSTSRVTADSRSRTRASSPTRSPTSRSAKARPAKASSGKRSTPPASSSCRCSSWSRTTATRSRCRSKCRRAGGDISRLVRSLSRPARRLDRRHRLLRAASARCARPPRYVRARKGPAFVHAHVIRPYSHSLSDDEKLYKTAGGARGRSAGAIRSSRFAEFLRTERASRPTRSSRRSLADVEREVNEAALDGAGRAEAGRRARAELWLYSPDVDPTSSAFETPAQPEGKPDTMVAAINRTLKDEMARDPRIVVFGEDVADASQAGRAAGRLGQGRRVQGDARPAAALRRRSRLQLAARRSQHRRPRDRHGGAQAQAGRRDSVLRLHLAGDDADPRRAVDDALSIGQQLVVPDGDSRADRRLPARRRAVPQPVGREHLRALPGHPHRLSVERASTRPVCCAPRFAATIRCCSSSTSTSTARPTTRASTPAKTS